jgi:hypothetical protein
MRYERLPGFWMGIIGMLLLLMICLGMGIVSIYGVFTSSSDLSIGMLFAAFFMGFLFLGVPFYYFRIFLSKSVRYLDIEASTLKIGFMGGKEVAVTGIQSMFLRKLIAGKGGGMDGLVIFDGNNEKEINGPFLFKDYKGMFAELEKVSGVKLYDFDGKPYFKTDY